MYVLAVVFVLATFSHQGHGLLKLSSYFADHMVLQRAPQQAVMWGTAGTEGDTVSITLSRQGAPATQVSTTVTQGKWKVKLPAQTDKGPYVIDVTASDGHVTLRDVLYGDVWLCSGQSNMDYNLKFVFNSSLEIQQALHHTDIRFQQADMVVSHQAQESMVFDTPWVGPSIQSLSSFSAVCWLFGQYLQSRIHSPIGLVQAAWGGTPIETWSPPQAIRSCQRHPIAKRSSLIPTEDSVLWNSMINPQTSATIKGAIWYQGEANSNRAEKYACQIEAMVREWRKQFHLQSLGQTLEDFFFGYVQLAGFLQDPIRWDFAPERWAQTANYGYSPNPALPNTFMAVAMDLPDDSSPYGAIHPRYKQEVCRRLVLGALNQAYGMSDPFQGPFPTGLGKGEDTLTVLYDQGQTQLQVKDTRGFEVCCSRTNTTNCDHANDAWVDAPITGHQDSQVILSTSGCGSRHVVGVRYAWLTRPCDYKQCSLYSASSGLPAPPYISLSLVADNNPEPIG